MSLIPIKALLGKNGAAGEKWESSGVAKKPPSCLACKFAPDGAGFCGDDSPKGKRMAIVCASPTKGEILEQIPWHGPQGQWYSWQYLSLLGIPRNEVMISHVIRCRPPRKGRSESDSYPTGATRRGAELTCRQFDRSHTYRGDLHADGIKEFAPTIFLVTFDPEKGQEVTAYKRIIQEDLKKAWRFVQQGEKVCVLMGEPPFALVGGGLVEEGGVKNWRGHYWRVEEGWPHDIGTASKPRFAPATSARRGRVYKQN